MREADSAVTSGQENGAPKATRAEALRAADGPEHAQSRRKTAVAYAMIYMFWGSTFLAVRYAVETTPPLLLVAMRQILAGLALYPLARLHSKEKTTPRQWLDGAIIGVLLIAGGNASISWAEARRTPSNVAAVLVATVPLWMAIFDWLRPKGPRPTFRIAVGLAIGLAGVGLLVSPRDPLLHTAGSAVNPICALVLFGGSLAWAAGSVFSRHLEMPKSPLLGAAIITLTGGVVLCIAALALGEGSQLHVQSISLVSWLSLGYLVVFGSIIGYSAYAHLLVSEPPARVATYAYVNPVVAVILGWAIAGEKLTSRMAVAAAVILVAVVLVITAPHPPEEGSGQPVVPD
ncbi:MAG: EamA family transporter [Candidatus Acidiferrales bacterium]